MKNYNEDEIMQLMEDVEYGWIDNNGNKNKEVNNLFSNNYRLQSPKEVIKSKIGICWDQVELERYYFGDNNYNIKTFFIVHYDYDKDNYPTHTFLIFDKNNKFYWFEHSWDLFKGIYEYDSLKSLLIDVKNKFIKYELKNKYKESNLHIHKYSKPKYNISVQQFYKHCENGEFIDIDKL